MLKSILNFKMVNITHTSRRCLSKIFAYQFKLSLQHTHTDKQV